MYANLCALHEDAQLLGTDLLLFVCLFVFANYHVEMYDLVLMYQATNWTFRDELEKNPKPNLAEQDLVHFPDNGAQIPHMETKLCHAFFSFFIVRLVRRSPCLINV